MRVEGWTEVIEIEKWPIFGRFRIKGYVKVERVGSIVLTMSRIGGCVTTLFA
jgi:hypothetical protein